MKPRSSRLTDSAVYGNDKLGNPARKSLGCGGTRFLHEDRGQPFYLLCFGSPFLAALLQPLLVMLTFQSVAKFHWEEFLGARESNTLIRLLSAENEEAVVRVRMSEA